MGEVHILAARSLLGSSASSGLGAVGSSCAVSSRDGGQTFSSPRYTFTSIPAARLEGAVGVHIFLVAKREGLGG